MLTTTYVCLASALLSYSLPTPAHRIAHSTNPSSHRARDDPVDNPHDRAADIELFAACMRSGLSQASAVAAVASTTVGLDKETWTTVAALLRLGCAADRAWRPMAHHAALGEVAELVILSQHGGTSIAQGLERVAESVRHTAETKQQAVAERAGVLIALPLTLCFLPAFILLGLVPIVIDLAHAML